MGNFINEYDRAIRLFALGKKELRSEVDVYMDVGCGRNRTGCCKISAWACAWNLKSALSMKSFSVQHVSWVVKAQDVDFCLLADRMSNFIMRLKVLSPF
jgi:hypothetical protein